MGHYDSSYDYDSQQRDSLLREDILKELSVHSDKDLELIRYFVENVREFRAVFEIIAKVK